MPASQVSEATLTKRKVWRNDIALDNQKVYLDYRNHSFPWRINAAKMEDARFNRQFSRAETEEIIKFRQAPLPISVSTAILDTADALHVSAKPTVSVQPIINPYDKAGSEFSRNVSGLYKHLIQKSWFNAYGGLQYDKSIFDRSTAGHGLMYTVPRMEYGQFTVDVKNISWKYFYADPSSIDPLYTDAEALIYALPITKAAAFRFVKSIEPEMGQEEFDDFFAKGSSVSSAFFEEDPVYRRPQQADKFLHFIQRITIEDDFVYAIIPLDKDANKAGDVSYRTSTMLTEDLARREAAGEIKIEKRRELFLTEYTSIGNYGYKVVYPVRRYNIVPLQYDHRGTPFPYSMMWYLYPLQRALNKFIMSSILNMSLLNTTKVMAEENSIIDQNEWITSAGQPNAILKYRMPVPGYSKAPEIIKPTPMDAAFLVMPQYITRMMEYVSGIYATMQGNPTDSPDVFSTVASLQSAGGQKIKRRQAHADASLSQLGTVMGEFYKEYAPLNGYSFDYDPETGEEQVIKYNEIQATPQIGSDGKVSVDMKINPANDLRKGFRDVRFISTGSMGYESGTEAAMLTTLATQLSIPELVPAILDRMNIPGIKEVKDQIVNRQDLTGKLEQITQVAQSLEKKNNELEGNINNLLKKVVSVDAQGKANVELTKLKENPEKYLNNALKSQGER